MSRSPLRAYRVAGAFTAPQYPGASGAEERRGRVALGGDLDLAQRVLVPVGSPHREDVHVELAFAVAVPLLEDPFMGEPDALERLRRTDVVGVRVRAEAVHREDLEGEVGHGGLGLAVGPCPPPVPAEPGAHDAAAV